MQNKDWEKMWEEGRSPWHKNELHEYITNYYRDIESSLKANPIRVFIPLCGKAVELLHFAKQENHIVTGIEISETACREYFKENNLKFVEAAEENGQKRLSTKNGKLNLFAGDLFEFKSEQKFDFIWDRGSLVAMNPEDREKYAKKMLELMGPGSKLLFANVPLGKKGPPNHIPPETIEDLYGGSCDIKRLEECAFLITKK